MDFHIAMTEAAHNPVFVAIMDALEGLLYRTALEPKYPMRQLDYVVNAHEYVLRPIRAKDADEAAVQMRRHLEIFRPLGWREMPEAHLALREGQSLLEEEVARGAGAAELGERAASGASLKGWSSRRPSAGEAVRGH